MREARNAPKISAEAVGASHLAIDAATTTTVVANIATAINETMTDTSMPAQPNHHTSTVCTDSPPAAADRAHNLQPRDTAAGETNAIAHTAQNRVTIIAITGAAAVVVDLATDNDTGIIPVNNPNATKAVVTDTSHDSQLSELATQP